MTIRMDSLIKTIATALDSVECELLGASTNHGKRIAVLCAKMGKALGKSPEEIMGMAICALLHDNALTEYILAERLAKQHDPAMKKHCEYGQRNVDALFLKTSVKDFILYHHERADGKGPFGIRAGEGPLEAELIAIADSIDVTYHLQRLGYGKLSSIQKIITDAAGRRYSKTAADALLEILDSPTIISLKDDAIQETTESAFTPWITDIEADTIFGLACLVTRIIDYKSTFTRQHSTQIASKAWFMAGYYKYDPVMQRELYLAAALHDIGKLEVPSNILEKPGKLTDTEYTVIKKHVSRTWELLKDIEGFQTICDWASNHHEKLNGNGYPFKKNANDLDFNSRLITCIDIYQAVSEERPYHPGRNHSDSMQILHKMVSAGEVDGDIANDINIALAPFDGKNVPPAKNQCFT
ncbi:MAG: HD domain-containing protein [Treponema sp.]|nr:HD domain-containing protein [Treponema sp.]